MKNNLRHKHAIMFPVIFVVSVLYLTIGGSLIVQAEQSSAWQVTKIMQIKHKETHGRGLLLFTDNPDKTGAAFRCDAGKLFAFLAVKPTDIREKLFQRTRNPRDREVRFSINGGIEKSETWVQMFNGQIYMARKISSILQIFDAAKAGAQITFTRKYGKTVTFSLPVADQEIFRFFIESCDLKKPFRPDLDPD